MVVIAIVVAVVLVVLLIALGSAARKKHKRFDFIVDPEAMADSSLDLDTSQVVEALPTVAESTEETMAKDFNYDATDDLLDPRNPRHDDWISEHPDNATNVDVGEGDDGPESSTASS
jgi:hypothetical protein